MTSSRTFGLPIFQRNNSNKSSHSNHPNKDHPLGRIMIISASFLVVTFKPIPLVRSRLFHPPPPDTPSNNTSLLKVLLRVITSLTQGPLLPLTPTKAVVAVATMVVVVLPRASPVTPQYPREGQRHHLPTVVFLLRVPTSPSLAAQEVMAPLLAAGATTTNSDPPPLGPTPSMSTGLSTCT